MILVVIILIAYNSENIIIKQFYPNGNFAINLKIRSKIVNR